MPIKYRSGLEKRLHQGPLKSWLYEPEKLQYWVEHYYTPDFVKGNIMIEAKGFFRAGDTQKYLAVRDYWGKEQELVFVFTNPNKPLPNTKVRKKTGTKRTMGEWAEANGFRYFTEVTIEYLI